MQKVKYIGKKTEYRVQFPVPLLSYSDREGEPVLFYRNKPVELFPHQAQQLVAQSPMVFVMVEE